MKLQIRGLTKTFGGLKALQSVDIEFSGEGPFWGVVGPNGSGKTTMFNCIAGSLLPDEGTVELDGARIPVEKGPGAVFAAGIGRVFQHPRLFTGMSVLDNLLAATPKSGLAAYEQALSRLAPIQLVGVAGRRAETLSIGQQKLIEVARALMRDPKLILLDEVAAGVNPRLIPAMIDYFRTMALEGMRFLVVEHDVALVKELCSDVVVLNQGEVLAQGPPSAVFSDADVRRVYLGFDDVANTSRSQR